MGDSSRSNPLFTRSPDAFAEALRDLDWEVIEAKGGFDAQCPAHGGEDLNLKIRKGDRGQPVVATCHSHECPWQEVVEAIASGKRRNGHLGHTPKLPVSMKETASYHYFDKDGNLECDHVRLEDGNGNKTFRWRSPDGKNKRPDGVPTRPYNADDLDLHPDATVYLCNGEKAVNAAIEADLEGVFVALGSGENEEPGPKIVAHFLGREVVIIADPDDAGIKGARKRRNLIAPITTSTRIVRSATEGEHDDLVDHLEAGFTLDDLVDFDLGEESRFFDLEVDMADSIEKGIPPVEFLVQDMIPKGQRGSVFGKWGAGKTMVGVIIPALQACRNGYRIVCVDEENGEETYRERLIAMGATREDLEGKFFYLGFSNPSIRDKQTFLQYLLSRQIDHIFFDTRIALLVTSGLDDNDPTGNRHWSDTFQTGPFVLGIGSTVIDHTGHEEVHRPRGASDKTGAVDYEWELEREKDFDEDTVGQVQFTLRKRRRSAAKLPDHLAFRVGGDPFVSERVMVEEPDSIADRKLEVMKTEIRDFLSHQTEVVSLRFLKQKIQGTDSQIAKAAKSLDNDPLDPVYMEAGPRSAQMYGYRGATDV